MRKLVLLVEDNPSDEKLTLRALSKAGVATEVAVARDGVEALEFLWLHGPTSPTDADLPAIVLLDLKLPRVDGLEVLRRIRERGERLPVVILTARDGVDDTVRGFEGGADDYAGSAKIAALGLRIRQGRSYHGLSLNVAMNLSPFAAINPCGYAGMAVTDLRAQGVDAAEDAVADALVAHLLRQLEQE